MPVGMNQLKCTEQTDMLLASTIQSMSHQVQTTTCKSAPVAHMKHIHLTNGLHFN